MHSGPNTVISSTVPARGSRTIAKATSVDAWAYLPV
jgi:hypothetical protein